MRERLSVTKIVGLAILHMHACVEKIGLALNYVAIEDTNLDVNARMEASMAQ